MSFAVPDTRVELHPVVAERRRVNSYNVAGLLEGSDPTLKAETIVYSGHFDHDGVGPLGILHGADDNGSGTVGVVELARAFAMNPIKPRRSILFVVFAAEERGLLGAYYYVAHPLRPLETHALSRADDDSPVLAEFLEVAAAFDTGSVLR